MRDLHNKVVCGTNATEPSTEADAPAESKLARGRYQANLQSSAKIKGCPVGHLFIFDSSLYVGEIRTKASRKQSCELFLAVTEAIRKAHAFIRRNCFEDGKNESLLLRQR